MNWKEWLMVTPVYDFLGKRSYAQSGEDIIAWGELSSGHVGPPLRGFYIDVGAYHPKVFSNTYLFYKKGWRGICVEPNPEMRRLHELSRPRDIFVNCGVGGKKSVMEYFEFDEGATNTFSRQQAEKNQKDAGRKLKNVRKIEIKTLVEILDQSVPKGQKIDLLSVDVEGLDEEVLRSNNWKKYRPEVIICEDLDFGLTLEKKNDSGVVGLLEGLGYKMVAKTPYSLIFKL